MKKIAFYVTMFALICSMIPGLFVTASAASDKADDDRDFQNYCGRLSIPAAQIDVALYADSSQYVCDRWDSACFFPIDPFPGIIIADHNNQEFATLINVTVGTIGQIVQEDGNIIYIRCAQVIDGHNTGDYITDGTGTIIMGEYDYLTYTCMNSWRNVRVCQWETYVVQNQGAR